MSRIGLAAGLAGEGDFAGEGDYVGLAIVAVVNDCSQSFKKASCYCSGSGGSGRYGFAGSGGRKGCAFASNYAPLRPWRGRTERLEKETRGFRFGSSSARAEGIGWHSLPVAAHGRISRCNVGCRTGCGLFLRGLMGAADEVPGERFRPDLVSTSDHSCRMCLSNVGWCLARSSHGSEPGGARGDLALEEEVPTWRGICVLEPGL